MSHTCHAIGCKTACKPEHLMCSKHWDMVTSFAKERVYAEYQDGQCSRDGGPTPQWHSAADVAIYQVHIKEIRELFKSTKAQRDELLAAAKEYLPYMPQSTAKEGGAASFSAMLKASDKLKDQIAKCEAQS